MLTSRLKASHFKVLGAETYQPGELFNAGDQAVFDEVMKHFEQHAPVCVMARAVLQRAITPQWVDDVFAEHRQRQYPRELLFSTVVELMTLVSLGLSPSLYAAATRTRQFPVSLAALDEKVNRNREFKHTVTGSVRDEWSSTAASRRSVSIGDVLALGSVGLMTHGRTVRASSHVAQTQTVDATAFCCFA